MSPDAAIVSRAVDRAVFRVRWVAAAESAALGAAVAAWSIVFGLVVALASAWLRAGRASRRSVVGDLERQNPQLRNLLITAEELASGALKAKPAVVDRVVHDARDVLQAVDVRRVRPIRRLLWLGAAVLAAWSASFALHVRDFRATTRQVSPAVRPERSAVDTGIVHIVVSVHPPSYTGIAPTTVADPVQIHAVENSGLTFSIEAAGLRVTLDFNGNTHELQRSGADRFEAAEVVNRSGYAAISSEGGAARIVPITVTPDALPSVLLRAPGRDLVYAGGDPAIGFEVRAADDYGLRSLSLRYTKVSGSGEQFEFTEGEIPLAIAKENTRAWKATATRRLSAFGLGEGDMLVYYAAAADARPNGGEGRSDAFFVEISRIGVAAGDAFTLPEQETRYALSQQMLIVKTMRLNDRRSRMSDAELANESEALAVEQRMIRSELVFMLGGEIEDEEAEAQQSTELQEGRLANRGQRDLREATVAMSQAERLLTAVDLTGALRMERQAVAALQRAFARDRYILRALPTQAALDANRRLTGVVGQPVGWRRAANGSPEDRRTAQLIGLVDGLAEAARAARAGADVRRQLAVLAGVAVRIDSTLSLLRQAAADLQKLADTWPATALDARGRALDSIVETAARETRRALADPAVRLEPSR